MYKLLVQPSFSGSWSLLHSLHDDRQANSWIRTCLVSVPGFAGLKKATGNLANSSILTNTFLNLGFFKTILGKVWSFCLKLSSTKCSGLTIWPNLQFWLLLFAEEVCTWWPLIHDQPGMVRVGSTGSPVSAFQAAQIDIFSPFLELQLSRLKKTCSWKFSES